MHFLPKLLIGVCACRKAISVYACAPNRRGWQIERSTHQGNNFSGEFTIIGRMADEQL
jgi:hypothetical protein